MFSIFIIGDKKVISRLESRQSKLMGVIKTTMKTQGIKLVAYIQTQKLQSDPLHHRSSRLQSSIKEEQTSTPTSVTEKVYTNVSYAHIHEFGFQGTESVRAHQRLITVAFGRPIAPTEVSVSAHTRQVNMPVRSFMRSSLKENTDNIRNALRAAVSSLMKNA